MTTAQPPRMDSVPRLLHRPVYHSALAPRALVVAKDHRFRRWARGQLRGSGFEIHVANDGFDALMVVEGDPPDVIVVDHTLPWFGTIGLLNGVCDDTGRVATPVVLVASRASDSFVAACCALGVAVLVRRPRESKAVLHVRAAGPPTTMRALAAEAGGPPHEGGP